MDVAEIKASLTRKVGPLPVWVWALLSAVLIYFLWKHHKSSGSVSGSGAQPGTGYPYSGTFNPNDQAGGGSISFPDLPSFDSLPNVEPQKSTVYYVTNSPQNAPLAPAATASEPVMSSQIDSAPIQQGGLFQTSAGIAPVTASGAKVVGETTTASGAGIPVLATPKTTARSLNTAFQQDQGSILTTGQSLIVSKKIQKPSVGGAVIR